VQAGGTISNAQMYDVARKDQNNFNVMLEVSKKLSSVRKKKRPSCLLLLLNFFRLFVPRLS
jgi:hypothetical protein